MFGGGQLQAVGIGSSSRRRAGRCWIGRLHLAPSGGLAVLRSMIRTGNEYLRRLATAARRHAGRTAILEGFSPLQKHGAEPHCCSQGDDDGG